MDIVFGPVPSRRLGRSLGVNNIPNKICSYGCVYCQLGKTMNFQVIRKKYYEPERIFKEAQLKIEAIGKNNVDFITFVPDGEPTLDLNLGKELKLLKSLKIPVAIITNSSLINNNDVREELMDFDLVSLKVDAVSEKIWEIINNPDKRLNLEKIKDGILEFSRHFKGKLITETMMVDGLDYTEEIPAISEFLKYVKPTESYISIPIRPTPLVWAKPPNCYILNYAFQKFSESVGKVEFLTDSEAGEFFSTGNLEMDILSITSVHPIREDVMINFLSKYGKDFKIIEKLITEKKLIKTEFNNHYFYIRNFREREALLH